LASIWEASWSRFQTLPSRCVDYVSSRKERVRGHFQNAGIIVEEILYERVLNRRFILCFWRATGVIISHVGSSHQRMLVQRYWDYHSFASNINSLVLVLHILHSLDALVCWIRTLLDSACTYFTSMLEKTNQKKRFSK
jgi:hypothetical protein